MASHKLIDFGWSSAWFWRGRSRAAAIGLPAAFALLAAPGAARASLRIVSKATGSVVIVNAQGVPELVAKSTFWATTESALFDLYVVWPMLAGYANVPDMADPQWIFAKTNTSNDAVNIESSVNHPKKGNRATVSISAVKPDWLSARWRLQGMGGGLYKVYNVWKPELCWIEDGGQLYVAGAGSCGIFSVEDYSPYSEASASGKKSRPPASGKPPGKAVGVADIGEVLKAAKSPDPAKPEPAKPDPAKPEPAKPAPAKPAPTGTSKPAAPPAKAPFAPPIGRPKPGSSSPGSK